MSGRSSPTIAFGDGADEFDAEADEAGVGHVLSVSDLGGSSSSRLLGAEAGEAEGVVGQTAGFDEIMLLFEADGATPEAAEAEEDGGSSRWLLIDVVDWWKGKMAKVADDCRMGEREAGEASVPLEACISRERVGADERLTMGGDFEKKENREMGPRRGT